MSTRPPFVIMSLPRSRSKWLSELLSFAGHRVWHDTLVECASLEEFAEQFRAGLDGCVETGAMVGWRALRKLVPELRLAVVRRPVEQVYESLRAKNWPVPAAELERRSVMLDEVAKLEGVFVLEYVQLSQYVPLAILTRELLGEALPQERFDEFAERRVEIDLVARAATLAAGATRIRKLKQEATMIEARLPRELEVEVCSWGELAADIDELAAAHYDEVSAGEGAPLTLNKPYFEILAQNGALLCVSARHKGKLIGYIMLTLAPSAEHEGELEAAQGPWYVVPGSPLRLGRYLLRARARGSTGVRGELRGAAPSDERARSGARSKLRSLWGEAVVSFVFAKAGGFVEWLVFR